MYRFVLVAIVASGCGTNVSANVNCKAQNGPVIECEVKQTTDKDVKFEVCWDFSIECANKATLVAERTCTSVNGLVVSLVKIPTAKIKITGTCEGEPTPKLANMTIDGK